MKRLISLVAGAALFVPSLVPVAFAHEKPLPPAFGKELVPDEATQERNEDRAAEIEEEKTVVKKHVTHEAPAERAGRKLHIQLDGDEDGGGSDDDGGDDDL